MKCLCRDCNTQKHIMFISNIDKQRCDGCGRVANEVAYFKEGVITIKKDNRVIATVETENDAFVWLLWHQGQSVNYAIKHGGFSVENENGQEIWKETK